MTKGLTLILLLLSAQALAIDRVCLYEEEDYQGWELCLERDHTNFNQLGINDKVSSLRIEGNVQVELYEHVNYRGFKRVYLKDSPRFDYQDDDAFSSLKIRFDQAVGHVCLYEEPHYQGGERCFTEDQANFKFLGINDRISSLRIKGDIQVQLYQHADYQGISRTYANNTPSFDEQMDKQFSSLKILSLETTAGNVCLYGEPHFQGWEKCFIEDQPNFAYLRINDQAASLKVMGPVQVKLYEHADYQGFSYTYTQDQTNLGAQSNQFSSLQIEPLKRFPPKPPRRSWEEDSDYPVPSYPEKRSNAPIPYEDREAVIFPQDRDTYDDLGNYFRLRNNGKCLQVDEPTGNGGRLSTRQCRMVDSQLWKLENHRLVSRTGRCLDLDSGSLKQDGGAVQVWDCHDRSNQQWRFDQGRLVNRANGKCLDLHEPDLYKEGGKVQVWACHQKVNQQWDMWKN